MNIIAPKYNIHTCKSINLQLYFFEICLPTSLAMHLSIGINIEEYNLIRMYGSRRRGRSVCYGRKSLSYNYNSIFFVTLQAFL